MGMARYNTRVCSENHLESPQRPLPSAFSTDSPVPEFRIFVEQTEQELFSLFRSIDQDRSGKIDKAELQAAFRNAGLAVSSAKLEQFMKEVDTDRDGLISFDEWR